MPLSLILRRGTCSVLALLLLAAGAGADDLTSIAVEADGSIVMVNRSAGSVVRVDPTTGATSTVSSDTVGRGVSLGLPWGIAVEGSGSLLVSVPGDELLDGQEKLVRVDPASGDRTTVSDATTGAGSLFQGPHALAVSDDGHVFALERAALSGGFFVHPRVLAIDPLTGDRTVVSDEHTGAGPVLLSPQGLGVEAAGTVVTTDYSPNTLIRIGPATGDRTIVSGDGTGTGPEFQSERGVAVAPDGALAVVESERVLLCVDLCYGHCPVCLAAGPSVMRVDPVTGDRSRISGGQLCVGTIAGLECSPIGGRGVGPALVNPRDIAFESQRFLVVVDEGRVVRVNWRTGRRTVLAEIGSTAAPAPTAGARSGARR